MEVQLDKLELKENDILIVKGFKEGFNVDHLSKIMDDKGLENIVILVPEGSSIETMDRSELLRVLRKIEQKINFERYRRIAGDKKDETA